MTRFVAWGMTGTVATSDPDREADAYDVVARWIERIDVSCNRFREDSELSIANREGGSSSVSETLALALVAARRASDMTAGACDPSVLGALEALGYDRDYAEVALGSHHETPRPVPAPGPNSWHFDESTSTLSLRDGCRLDLGASAKALLADCVVSELSIYGGALCEVGGDVSMSAPAPQGGWVIGLSDVLHITGHEPKVALEKGAIATSSSAVRSWRQGTRVVNHLVDPFTGDCVEGPFVTASVAADDAVSANAYATAALVWGERAPERLTQSGVAARLIDRGGRVVHVNGWPSEAS